jgi:dephospho-CoA kinase
MLIGVVGLNGSGKDTVAQYHVQRHGYARKDLGQEIRDELKRQGRNHLDRNEMIALGNEMRQKNGFNYWCKRAIDAAEAGSAEGIVITSIRNPSEADEITKRGGVIMEVFADQKLRFDRTVARVKSNPGSHGDIGSFEDFKNKEEKELRSDDPAKQQLLKCISMAEHRLDNNGSFEQLYEGIDLMHKKLAARKE